MAIKGWLRAAFVGGVLMVAGAVQAHHSPAAWDVTKRNSIKGVVKEASFRNPHGEIKLTVTNDKGQTEEWRIETSAASLLRRRGWDFSRITPGTPITATGHLNKETPRELYLREVQFQDGTGFGDKGGNDAALD
jgi:hypothetical protein